MHWLERYGYSLNWVSVSLWPLSLAFAAAVRLRRFLYRKGLLKSEGPNVPIIVVGNISVGGAGKTPLVARLVELARHAGYRPGVVARGYGGQSADWPRRVTPDSDPAQVGDEPVLLARRCGCPVAVGPDRVAAARALVEGGDCDVIISDDGLQHYRLRRDLEIVVVDGFRRFGNGACLPAGPLREPPSRLREADFVVGNGAARGGEYLMALSGDTAVDLRDPSIGAALGDFRKSPVRAVAGIGDPWRFFNHLRHARLQLVEHPFPDHYRFRAEDLQFPEGLPVLMTEKDAVKCRRIAPDNSWYVPVGARLEPEFEARWLERLAAIAVAKGVCRPLGNPSGRPISKSAAELAPLRGESDGPETAGDLGVPGQQGPAELRQGATGIDLQGKPAGLSDPRRNSGDAGVRSATANG